MTALEEKKEEETNMDESNTGESDLDRFFLTFESIIKSVAGDKMKIPKWEKKLKKIRLVVQFKLWMEPTFYYMCYLKIQWGTILMMKGTAPSYDLEFSATPDDLFNFTNRTYGTVSMVLKKNIYGQPRLKIKKGGRNVLKLLMVSKLLVV